MADEVTTEKVEKVAEEPQKKEVVVEKPKQSLEELIAENESLKRTNLNKIDEAKRVHEKLEKFEQDEEKRKLAELTEMDRLKLEAKTAKEEAAESKQKLLRREIAAKVGENLKVKFPEILISRIQGETPEDMEADAKKLMEELPKAKTSNTNTTNPGGGDGTGETREQRIERLR